ncbi:S8 family serine peptidase [Pseudoalteromonas piratica]|uniref:S8 family serine peptidase n=1 Tax=Pseudoalteromonas piratica TaxID=1348114 RepID=UPI00068E056B|nr:S8 family serine peptidase [Pseudoalteromonas piratica]
MSILAKKGLFAVSLCALSVSSALYASATQYITVGNDTQKITKEPGIVSSVFHVTDKDGKVISQKVYRRFEKERFIVELHNAPLIQAKHQIKNNVTKQFLNSKTSSATQESIIRSQLQQAQARIETDQQATIQQIQSINKNIKLLSRFSRTSNAIVIEADKTSLNAIKQLPNVKRVSPDTIKSIDLSESVSLVNAPLIWAMTDANSETITGKGISVAILDTGIDYNHVDLGGCLGENCRITHGYDFVNNDNDPMDGHGHGTHVAGIVGANGTLKGVAPDVTFHAYKVLSDYGSGATSGIIAALERSVDPDGDINTDDAVDIVNMSLGGGGSATDPLSIATNNTVDAGVIVVVAAGNDGYYGAINASSPAAAEKAITVASSTKQDAISDFSSKATQTEIFNKPEITAPGSSINSTLPNSEYGYNSGTSMAAPHVAGAIALLKQNDPSLSSKKATQLLAAGAINIGSDPLAQGPGRMDIEKSIKATTTANDTAINFGKLDTASNSWSSTRSITINNHSGDEKNYQITAGDGLPTGATISFSETSFTLPANSSHTLNFDLTVPDTTAIPFATSSAGIHFSNITISSDTDELRIPTYFEHSVKLTLKTNSPSQVSATIIDELGRMTSYYLDAFSPVELNSPGSSIFISATYFDLDTSDITVAPDVAKLKYGASSHQLELTETTEFLLDVNQLTNITGINSATNHSGDNILSKTHNFYGSTDFWTGTRGFGWGYFPNEFTHIYLALGEIANTHEFKMSSHFKFSESASEEGYYLHSRKIIDGISVASDIDIDLSSLSVINILPPNPEKVDQFSISDRNTNSLTQQVDSKINKINIYQPQQNDFIDFKQFVTYKYDPIQGRHSNSIYSNLFDLNESGELRIYSDRPVQTSDSNELNFSETSRRYFNGTINVSDSKLVHSPSRWDRVLFSDHQGNTNNPEANYSFYCENEEGKRELLSSGSISYYHATAERPEANCEKLLYTISYKNNYFDSSSTSVLTFNLADSDIVTTADYISLKHADKLYAHHIVNKIDSTLTLEQDGSLNLKSVEMRLNDSEWQVLDYSIDDDSFVSIPLDLVEGSFDADIRITTTSSMGNDVVHTLNDYFKFGTDSGDVNDADNDGIPNDTDPDDDNDGYNDDVDAFPYNSQEWLDSDGDGLGDNADTDDDNDGYLDTEDAFPLDPTEWLDTDGDGIGNNADTDDDGDGHSDEEDAFPLDPSEWVDTDEDGTGNNSDIDDDNDGYLDDDDAFPLDATEWLDTDGDGIGNNADTDDDNDGVNDNEDAFPLDATESVDTDGDGIGNNADTDDDNDGISDNEDAFPLDATESVDTDGDGIGNNADTDDDNDGVADSQDAFPLDETESVDTDGDGIGNNADTDDDGDGVSDAQDAYPLDASRSSAPDNNAAENTSSSSGGSLPLIGLFALISITLRRFRRK